MLDLVRGVNAIVSVVSQALQQLLRNCCINTCGESWPSAVLIGAMDALGKRRHRARPSCKALRNRQHELERQSLTHPTPCDWLTLLTARVHQNFDALQTGQLSAQHGISWLV